MQQKHKSLNIKDNNLTLEEGDFYFEDGFMVFTAQYLTKRGFCCKNACRHCPYGFNSALKK